MYENPLSWPTLSLQTNVTRLLCLHRQSWAHPLPLSLRWEWDTVTVHSVCHLAEPCVKLSKESLGRFSKLGLKWVRNGMHCAALSKEIIFTITGLSHFPFFTSSPPLHILSVGMKLKGHEPGFCLFPLNIFIFRYDNHIDVWQYNICHLRVFTESAMLTSYFYAYRHIYWYWKDRYISNSNWLQDRKVAGREGRGRKLTFHHLHFVSFIFFINSNFLLLKVLYTFPILPHWLPPAHPCSPLSLPS